MRQKIIPSAIVILLCSGLLLSLPANKDSGAGNWPSFRGPGASGIAEGYSLPVTWDVSGSVNILWKTPIPGLGHSSPIVWKDRIFLSTAISGMVNPQLKTGLYGDIGSVKDDTPHSWIVYCLDKRTGKKLWERTVRTAVPKVKRHPKSTHANSTLATDGTHVVAFFGSEGLYCFDMNGKQLWKRDLGLLDSAFYVVPQAQWEFASSPVIYRDMVLIQCDVLNGSFVAALKIRDGSDVWRTARNEVPTWGTPTVFSEGNHAQMVVNGYKHIGGYDVNTGKEVWRLEGGGDIPTPTPVVAGGLIFITNAHGKLAPIYAVRADATGDISLKGDETSNRFVAWSAPRDGSYMATPLVYGDFLYNCRINGVLSCYEARSGTRSYQERLGAGATGFSASPVAGDGKIYFAGEDGDVYVVKAGPRFELLSKNSVGEECMASPAISEGVIYFRTRSTAIAIAAKPGVAK